MSLLEAVNRMDVDRAAVLLFRGADVNVRDGPRGVTPLLIACHRGEVRMVDLLLGAKASTKLATNDTQSSCLHIAAKNNSADIVRSLLRADPGIEERPTWQGDTALMVACLSAVETEASAETLSALLQPLPADTNDPERSRGQASGLAPGFERRRSGDKDVVFLGPDDPRLRARNRHGHTALHCAAFGQSPNAVRKLLEAGADVTARDKAGRTAVKIALEKVEKEKQAAAAAVAAVATAATHSGAVISSSDVLGSAGDGEGKWGVEGVSRSGAGKGVGMAAAKECLRLLQERWAELEEESKERELRLLGELDGDSLGEGGAGPTGKGGRRGGSASGGSLASAGKRGPRSKKKKKSRGAVAVGPQGGATGGLSASSAAGVRGSGDGEASGSSTQTGRLCETAEGSTAGKGGEVGGDGGSMKHNAGGEVVGSSSEGEGETDDEVRSHPSSEAESMSCDDPAEGGIGSAGGEGKRVRKGEGEREAEAEGEAEPEAEEGGAEAAGEDDAVKKEAEEGGAEEAGEEDAVKKEVVSGGRKPADLSPSPKSNGGDAAEAEASSVYGDGGSWSVVARPARRKKAVQAVQSSSPGAVRDASGGVQPVAVTGQAQAAPAPYGRRASSSYHSSAPKGQVSDGAGSRMVNGSGAAPAAAAPASSDGRGTVASSSRGTNGVVRADSARQSSARRETVRHDVSSSQGGHARVKSRSVATTAAPRPAQSPPSDGHPSKPRVSPSSKAPEEAVEKTTNHTPESSSTPASDGVEAEKPPETEEARDESTADGAGDSDDADGDGKVERTTVTTKRQLNANADVWTPKHLEANAPGGVPPPQNQLSSGHTQQPPLKSVQPALQQQQVQVPMQMQAAATEVSVVPAAAMRQPQAFSGAMPPGTGPSFCTPLHAPHPPPPTMAPQHQYQHQMQSHQPSPSSWGHQPPVNMIGVAVSNGGVLPPPMAAGSIGVGGGAFPMPQAAAAGFPYPMHHHPSAGGVIMAEVGSGAPPARQSNGVASGASSSLRGSPSSSGEAGGHAAPSPDAMEVAQAMLESSSPQAAAVALRVEHLVWGLEEMKAGLSMGQMDTLKSVLLDQLTRIDEAKLEVVRAQERSKSEEKTNAEQLKQAAQVELGTGNSVAPATGKQEDSQAGSSVSDVSVCSSSGTAEAESTDAAAASAAQPASEGESEGA